MAYINVDEVYILDNTGLQVDMATDIPFADAGFTDAQKAQARANIAAGGTNPNLLDNPFFTAGAVINQRGSASYSASAATYTIDRWQLSVNSLGTATLTLATDGATIANGYAGGQAYFIQKLDEGMRNAINGKTVTMSVLYQDGTVKSGSGVFTLGTTLYAINDTDINFRIYSPNTSRAEPTLDIKASQTIAIKAVKLELGSVSTLANDVPPDYGTELAKCQRYFVRYKFETGVGGIGWGYAHTTSALTVFLPLPVFMASTPTIAQNGALALQNGVVRYNITSINTIVLNGDILTLSGNYTVVSGTAVAGTNGALLLRENGYIDISADIV